MIFRRLQSCLLATAWLLAGGCASTHLLSTTAAEGPLSTAVPAVVAAPPPPADGAARRPSPPSSTAEGTSQASASSQALLPQRGLLDGAPERFAPLTGGVPRQVVGFGHVVFQDTVAVLSSPLHWDRYDWSRLGLAAAAVGATMPFDESIARRAQAIRSPGMDRVATGVQQFGSLGAFGVIGGFYLAGAAFHDQRAREVAVDSVVSSIIAGGLITPLIKEVAGRYRPRDTGDESGLFDPMGGHQSFPSGHTTEAFAVASVVAGHYHRTWVKALSYGLASMVGLARVEQDAHFASDVLAGALIGTSVGQMVVHLNDERREERRRLAFTVGPMFSSEGPGVAFHLAW